MISKVAQPVDHRNLVLPLKLKNDPRTIRIECEYEEPLIDVLIGYAEMGESVTALSSILGVRECWPREVVKELGIGHMFKSVGESRACVSGVQERHKNNPKVKEAAKARELKENGFWHEGRFDHFKGHCQAHGISRSTVRSRLARGWTLSDALSKPPQVFRNTI